MRKAMLILAATLAPLHVWGQDASTQADIQKMEAAEKVYELIFDATEVHSGRAYEIFLKTLEKCGCEKNTRLYVARKYYLGAMYVNNSRAPFRLRPGKIFIAQDIIDLLSDDDLAAMFAHELGHRNQDFGTWSVVVAGSEKARWSPEVQTDADRFGAEIVGKDAIVRWLKNLRALMLAACESEAQKSFDEDKKKVFVSSCMPANKAAWVADINIRVEILQATR